MAFDTIIEDGIDILVVGAGLGGTGAASAPVSASSSTQVIS